MKRAVNKKVLSIILVALLAIGTVLTSGLVVFAEEEGAPKLIMDLNGGTAEEKAVELEEEVNEELIEGLKTFNVPEKSLYNNDSAIAPPENCEFAGFEVTTNKDGKTITAKPGETLVDLDFSEGGTIKFLWVEKYYTVTLHVSTIDGEDQIEPIVIENVPTGSEIEEALKLLDSAYTLETSLFTLEGYVDSNKSRIYKSFSEYSEYNTQGEKLRAFSFDAVEYDDYVYDDIDIFYCLTKPIYQAKITVEPPVCGEETKTPKYENDKDYDMLHQENAPKVSVADDNYFLLYTNWIDAPDNEYVPFVGTFEGDQAYYFDMEIYPYLGYSWDDNIKEENIEIRGAELEKYSIEDYFGEDAKSLYVSLKTNAEHEWGEWTVTKEATEEADGVSTRYCKNNSEHMESVAIPKLPKEDTKEPEPKDTEEENKEENKGTDEKPQDNKQPDSTTDKTSSQTSTNKDSTDTKAEATKTATTTKASSTKASTTKASSTKASTTTKASTSAVPKTGDESNPALFMMMFAVSIALSGLYIGRIKRH